MRQRVKSISIALTVLSSVALLAIGYVGFSTLAPTSRADANIPTIELATVPVGEIELVGFGSYRIAIARLSDTRAVVFHIGTVRSAGGNQYTISGPDSGDPYVVCERLNIDEQSIACHNKVHPVYRWTSAGSPSIDAPSWQPSLPIIPHEVHEGELRYGRGV